MNYLEKKKLELKQAKEQEQMAIELRERILRKIKKDRKFRRNLKSTLHSIADGGDSDEGSSAYMGIIESLKLPLLSLTTFIALTICLSKYKAEFFDAIEKCSGPWWKLW